MFDKDTAKKAQEMLGDLKKPVRLIAFTQEIECGYCEQNNELVKEVSELSDKITYEIHDFVKDKETGERYKIDKIPAIVVATDEKDYGLRFFGIPSGYEFVSLIESIKLVSTGLHELAPATVEKMSALKTPVHIQVFVTPTCPYCPRAVVLAHKLAYVSDTIRSDMIEAIEFPHLANRYNVMGVPRSVINEKDFIEGAVPEAVLVDKVLESIA